jgi:hypothetical protein
MSAAFKFFARAVVTGFGLSLGAALFKRVQEQLGLADDDKDEKAKDKSETLNRQDGATDPGLQRS